MSIFQMILEILARVCLILVFIFLISRMRFFKETLDRDFNTPNRVLLILSFGLISMYGTYSGLRLDSGFVISLGNLGPLLAGLLGGPMVGLGAGLVGGIYRLAAGGLGAAPTAIALVVIGLAAGVIYNIRRGKLISVGGAILTAVLAEGLVLGMLLLLADPYSEALRIVKATAVPALLANAFSTGIIWIAVRKLGEEREKEGFD